jgi:hypothetical protein
MVSSATALVVAPLVSLFTPYRARPEAEQIWASFRTTGSTEETGETDTFHLVPITPRGKLGAVLVLAGFAVFLFGVLSAAFSFAYSGTFAVIGMITVFVGGLIRVYAE